MKVILDGPVTDEMLDTAELFGIEATSYVANGLDPLPFTVLDVKIVWNKSLAARWDTLSCRRINHYTITHAAEAVIMKGKNDHLMRLADLMGIPVYQED